MNFLEILSTAPLLRGMPLRLEFPQWGDRIGQRLCLVSTSGDSLPLLESTDRDITEAESATNGDNNWPTSPPVQQLLLEERGNDKVALGVGMFGKHHWAVSVLRSDNMLQFEIACRVNPQQGTVGQFQSCYRLCRPENAMISHNPQQGQLRVSWPDIGTLIVNSSHVLHASADDFTILADASATAVVENTSNLLKAITVMWQYTWSWEE